LDRAWQTDQTSYSKRKTRGSNDRPSAYTGAVLHFHEILRSRAAVARPAGMAAARVISKLVPGLLNFAISEHFEFVWANPTNCTAKSATGMKISFIVSPYATDKSALTKVAVC
jgi:hypothetical protein